MVGGRPVAVGGARDWAVGEGGAVAAGGDGGVVGAGGGHHQILSGIGSTLTPATKL